ncbi:MAG: type II toxin-antitoxin system prevent-host-death family antitoxin [Acetobacteraceae bacterium]
MSAREAKNAFEPMIHTGRAGPVLIAKHRRGVAVVLAVEEYQRFSARPEHADNAADGIMGALASRS